MSRIKLYVVGDDFGRHRNQGPTVTSMLRQFHVNRVLRDVVSAAVSIPEIPSALVSSDEPSLNLLWKGSIFGGHEARKTMSHERVISSTSTFRGAVSPFKATVPRCCLGGIASVPSRCAGKMVTLHRDFSTQQHHSHRLAIEDRRRQRTRITPNSQLSRKKLPILIEMGYSTDGTDVLVSSCPVPPFLGASTLTVRYLRA